MKSFILTTAIVVAAGCGTLWPAAPAQAQWAPWCVQYWNRSGVRQCSFYSYRQCAETVSGIGGYCFQNPDPRAGRRARPY
jgi:hypothetical protein